ncbi:hypothetical protein GCM10025873_10960 [Demequina sediminis]|nr:hypothetical protein GCM10025873_10960 [Demequina sediminis]
MRVSLRAVMGALLTGDEAMAPLGVEEDHGASGATSSVVNPRIVPDPWDLLTRRDVPAGTSVKRIGAPTRRSP